MKQSMRILADEGGFALVVGLVIMVLLTILGLLATTTSVFELHISGSDRATKRAFYKADGGEQAGIALVEENLNCPSGFSATSQANGIGNFVSIKQLDFAYNKCDDFVANEDGTCDAFSYQDDSDNTVDVAWKDFPSDKARSITLPDDLSSKNDTTSPHTNLAFYGKTVAAEGSAIQMVAGYEGVGKSASQSGTVKNVYIHSQYLNPENDSQIKVMVKWGHIIGKEGACKF